MNTLDTQQMITDLQEILRDQVHRLEELRRLDDTILSARPSPEKWSINEIAEHMILSSGHYFKLLRKAYADPGSGLVLKREFTPGRFGEMGVKAMRPTAEGSINWKMRTLGMFEPRKSLTKGAESLDELRSMLEGFMELLEKGRTRGVEGVKITSTLGPLLRFKAGDAFRFPIAHQQRHFLQMERTLEQVMVARSALRA